MDTMLRMLGMPGESDVGGAGGWQRAEAPQSVPTEEARTVGVPGATLSPFGLGRLPNELDGPLMFVRGAAYDDAGELVGASQRPWAGDLRAPVSADPQQVVVRPRKQRLRGRWLFLPHWSHHFGHFLLETLPGLWPDPRDVRAEGIVAYRDFRQPVHPMGTAAAPQPPQGLKPWQEEMLGLAGYADLPVRILRTTWVRVDHLVVPTRATLLKAWARPEATRLWDRMADEAGDAGERRVFFSRRLFHEAGADAADGRRARNIVRGSAASDAALEERFSSAGFAVVHPETLPLREQVAVARGAEVLAGPVGSAMHLAAFARPGARVLELGDSRTPHRGMRTQQAICAAREHLTGFVPHGDDEALTAWLRRV